MSSQAINSFGDFPACVKDFMNFEFCEVNVVKLANAYAKNQESVNFSKQEFDWFYDGEVPNEFKTERTKKIEEANTKMAKIRAKFGINCMMVDFGFSVPNILTDGDGKIRCPKNEDEWKACYNHFLKNCYEEIKDFYEKQKEREEWLEKQKQELIDKRKQQEGR